MNFDPSENPMDARILYKITGRRVDGEAYSSDEDEAYKKLFLDPNSVHDEQAFKEAMAKSFSR
eukprot:CAMPEP_0116874720 /NCGR_PEP_ID=MMETSP0463-20121206/6264_1 /TAXON_ID=181622 /ORGANISM="Strombidinopsis sp, Strain SopsisLIS2011" /LENGTH=62 /DNA_ID=CAMNT_0004518811 /DNA_START=1480 /DNA_END=1668 /DNA_ORIENTATION=-